MKARNRTVLVLLSSERDSNAIKEGMTLISQPFSGPRYAQSETFQVWRES